MRTIVRRRMLFLATSIVHLFVEPNAAPALAEAAGSHAAGQLPFPASVESVIERGSIEDYPVAVVRFRSRLPADEVLALTVQAWRRGADSVVDTSAGGWRVLSVYEVDRYRTLQLRGAADGGTDGLLSVWERTARAAASPDAGREVASLLPPGARVLRSLAGTDAGRRHRTLVALADGSPAWVAQALEVRVIANGFTRDPAARDAAGSGPVGEVRLYRGEGRSLGITFHPHDARTAIVIHLTEAYR